MNSSIRSALIDSVAGSPRQRLFGFSFCGICLLLVATCVGFQLRHDLAIIAADTATRYFLLVMALFIVLGFEFVKGFHGAANAVATVTYTRSLPARLAVVWCGAWNFVGVIVSRAR